MSTSVRDGQPARAAAERPTLLRISGLSAYYGELRAIFSVDMSIVQGDVVSIIGANGAGKSTLLKAVVGLMNRGAAAHTRGEISLRNQRIDTLPSEAIVDAGVAMVPEGRRLFARMSVEDNLLVGAYLPRCRTGIRDRLAEMYELFPRLSERRRQIVAQMSGGEQQMVAIARALMSSPSLLLLDELSLGLAPVVVEEIYKRVDEIHRNGVTCIIIEQDMKRALAVADYVYVMLEGGVVLQGRPDSLTESQVSAAYFGADSTARH